MSPLVKKEIRLLLPGWAVSLVLALSIWLVPADPHSIPVFTVSEASFTLLLFLFYPITLVMTALSSFGSEISSGTFHFLLAQPVTRSRIWWTKTGLLAAAVLSAWLAWCLSCSLHQPIRTDPHYWRDLWLLTGLFAIAVYSGGLWTVLLFRQVAVAFWLANLTPVALFVTAFNLLPGDVSDETVTEVLAMVFGVYGVVGFWFARRLFMRAQDTQWTGGTLALPEIRELVRFKIASGARRKWQPWMALLVKELRLHESQFIIAGVLVLLHLGVIATRHFGYFSINSLMAVLLECYWWLWLVMPLLVGCAAVAEERKLGTHEGQLCLPVKRRTQFAVKLWVVLALAILFGAVMPWLLEGKRFLPGVHFFSSDPRDCLVFGNTGVWPILLIILRFFGEILYSFVTSIAGISAGIAALSFYASTQARNTLQALGLALMGILLTLSLSALAYWPERFASYPLDWPIYLVGHLIGLDRLVFCPLSWLIYLIGVPVLLLVLAALAYWNYQYMLVGWSVWRRNLIVLVSLALVIMAMTALYHRVWLMPFDSLTLASPGLGSHT
jgi:ABC-type transport system involved in multi-copper enzyme maturation permease subunit